MKGRRRIFVVEDHPIFRLGLRELLEEESDFIVCGEADDIGSALEEIARTSPDLVIVDLSLKGRSGIDLLRDLRARYRDLPLLVLSMYDEALYAERALAAGARGYIMKQETSDSIVHAVRRVLEGKVYLSERVVGDLVGKLLHGGGPGGGPGDRSPLERLTDRELEVFRLIGKGCTTGDIAERLHLSAKTIGTYRERIKEKLRLKNAAELTLHAIRLAGAD
ncbi:MAG: response regulator transcription factor [Thermodesulfobacteriota bacterium]|jgi:DNA-binding NarL/FixJ family response regulator